MPNERYHIHDGLSLVMTKNGPTTAVSWLSAEDEPTEINTVELAKAFTTAATWLTGYSGDSLTTQLPEGALIAKHLALRVTADKSYGVEFVVGNHDVDILTLPKDKALALLDEIKHVTADSQVEFVKEGGEFKLLDSLTGRYAGRVALRLSYNRLEQLFFCDRRTTIVMEQGKAKTVLLAMSEWVSEVTNKPIPESMSASAQKTVLQCLIDLWMSCTWPATITYNDISGSSGVTRLSNEPHLIGNELISTSTESMGLDSRTPLRDTPL
jgi:hypothetical protein